MGHIIPNKEDELKVVRGYVFGVEWIHEIPNCIDGNVVHWDISDFYERGSYPDKDNWPQDGLVEVEIRFIRHIDADKCWEEYQKVKNK